MWRAPHASSGSWRVVVPIVALLTLPACLLVVSTGPTPVEEATIVFVAIDDRGALVASLQISVADHDGPWRDSGLTAQDGSFRCAIRSGVGRVHADVTLPAGYVLRRSDPWPREIDVPSAGSLRVEIRVTSA
jgi:hypothetical protein